MLNNKIKSFYILNSFSKFYFPRDMSVFLNRNLLSYHLLKLTFYNDRLFNFLSKKIKFGLFWSYILKVMNFLILKDFFKLF